MANNPGKQTPLAKHRREGWDEARESYLLEHTPGLKEHDAAQHRAFLHIEEDALARHPDPSAEDIAAAEAAEAALPSKKRTEIQLRRSFESLAVHLPRDARRKRKSFVQRRSASVEQSQPDTAVTGVRGSTYGRVHEDLWVVIAHWADRIDGSTQESVAPRYQTQLA